jgi:BTB/POZ domain-containing protein 9
VALDLLVLADRYEFLALKNYLEKLLSERINLSSVLQLMSYADVYSAKSLHKQCAEYVDSHARQILVSPSILLVPKEHLKALLQRDSFFAREIDIFEAVMR